MMILKCKMCGGDLNFEGGRLVVECEYCGTRQTVPNADNEKKANLFNRANRLRMSAEFDKAAGVYESIVAEYPEEAEAYWGLCLCAYGIEYVDDPASGKKIPTCHRTLAEAVAENENFMLACSHADAIATRQYRREAREIDRLQKEILSIASSESPYDVFICYKETDADGKRTQDSVIAQDIYDALTAKRMKVFFARITLEDKLGQQYEPYIFAALHSARVMLAIGTCFEHFDAVWVKNEWSRFLDMMKEDKTKVLIPCYSGLDAYDIPAQMRALQAQDMGRIGFMQDLVRGVEKIVDKAPVAQPVYQQAMQQSVQQAVQQVMQQTTVNQQGAGVDSLMRRAQLFLEDRDWDNARVYLERVLDINPEYAPAYIGKVMIGLSLNNEEQIAVCDSVLDREFEKEPDWAKAMRFATTEQKVVYEGYLEQVSIRREEKRKSNILAETRLLIQRAERIKEVEEAIRTIKKLGDVSGEKEAIVQAKKKISLLTTTQYPEVKKRMKRAKTEDDFLGLAEIFGEFGNYLDSEALKNKCLLRAEKIRKKQIGKEKRKRIFKRCLIVLCLLFVIIYMIIYSIRPTISYNQAEEYLAAGQNEQAAEAFVSAGEYKDAKVRAAELYYSIAVDLDRHGNSLMAASAYRKSGTPAGIRRAGTLLLDARIAAGRGHTVGLAANGTVVAVGDKDDNRCGVSGWQDIVAVAAGDNHTVGLKADGTVVAVGYNHSGQRNVQTWTDITAITAGTTHTVGLRRDGSVVAVGDTDDNKCNVNDWFDIVAVAAGSSHTLGLKADGTVVVAGDRFLKLSNSSKWKDIVAIDAYGYGVVGLKEDGTVVVEGVQIASVSEWRDIVAVAQGFSHTVGLKADGTVVAAGSNSHGQCDVSEWHDIVAIAAGDSHTVGLKADGSVVAVGHNYEKQCNVSEWDLL